MLVVAICAACGGSDQPAEAKPSDVARMLRAHTDPNTCPLLDADDVIAAFEKQPMPEGQGTGELLIAEKGDKIRFPSSSIDEEFGIGCEVTLAKKDKPRNDPSSPDYDPNVSNHWALMWLGVFIPSDGLDGNPDDLTRKIGKYTLAIDADQDLDPAVFAAIADAMEQHLSDA